MDLLPAVDLRHGRVVRLRQGDDALRTVYGDDPAAVLEAFASAGVRLAHVVDLDAAFGEAPQRALIEDLVRRSTAGTAPEVQLGGGLRDAEAVAWALGLGVARVVLGSMVVRDPERFAELAQEYEGQVVPALDLAVGDDGAELRVAGWRESAPEPLSQICRRLAPLRCVAVLVTDIGRDGTGEGPNLELAASVGSACKAPALLSGGVGSLADLERASGRPELGGVVVGRALYEGAFSLEDAVAVLQRGAQP